AGVRAPDGPRAAEGQVPHADALQARAAPALSRLPAGVLVDAHHDRGASRVRRGVHGLHPDRHPVRGARPDPHLRRRVPPLQGAGRQAAAAARPQLQRAEGRPMIDDRFGGIDYDERGQGPTLVLVPGSCSTGAAWRPIIAHWQDRYRCVTTSLLGYGRPAERRTSATADMAYEAEMLEAGGPRPPRVPGG